MPDHPKFEGDDWAFLFALHVASSCFCSQFQTDGFLRATKVPDLARRLPQDRDWAALMVERGLWEETKGGYLVHDYHDYNPTKEQVAAERRAAAERQRAWRDRNTDDNAVSSRRDVTPERSPSPSRPVPSPTTTKTQPATPAPKKPPTALYALYEAVKHDLWGANGEPDQASQRRDWNALKSLRAVWKDSDIIAATHELRRQADAGEVHTAEWPPGCRFGAFALRTKFDAGTWWMDKLLADVRRNEEHQPKKPALKALGDVMRNTGIPV